MGDNLTEMCLSAELRHLKRGDMVICVDKKGNDTPKGVPVSLLKLSPGEVCVATTLYNTGHLSPDANYDCNKMHECPYRRA